MKLEKLKVKEQEPIKSKFPHGRRGGDKKFLFWGQKIKKQVYPLIWRLFDSKQRVIQCILHQKPKLPPYFQQEFVKTTHQALGIKNSEFCFLYTPVKELKKLKLKKFKLQKLK